jgi:hypothetical protein
VSVLPFAICSTYADRKALLPQLLCSRETRCRFDIDATVTVPLLETRVQGIVEMSEPSFG